MGRPRGRHDVKVPVETPDLSVFVVDLRDDLLGEGTRQSAVDHLRLHVPDQGLVLVLKSLRCLAVPLSNRRSVPGLRDHRISIKRCFPSTGLLT